MVGGPCGDEYSRVQLFTYTLVVGIGVLVVCGAGHPTVDGECSRKMTRASITGPPPRKSGYEFEFEFEYEFE